jgi:hypothetical protein
VVVIGINASVTSPAVVNFTASNATLRLYPKSSNNSKVNVTLENVAGQLLLPPGATVISAINLTYSHALSMVEATIRYPCSTPSGSIAPYELVNGTWSKITNYTVDPRSCTVTFSVAGGNVTVALISGNLSKANVVQYLIYAGIGIACAVLGAVAFYIYSRRRGTGRGK